MKIQNSQGICWNDYTVGYMFFFLLKTFHEQNLPHFYGHQNHLRDLDPTCDTVVAMDPGLTFLWPKPVSSRLLSETTVNVLIYKNS